MYGPEAETIHETNLQERLRPRDVLRSSFALGHHVTLSSRVSKYS